VLVKWLEVKPQRRPDDRELDLSFTVLLQFLADGVTKSVHVRKLIGTLPYLWGGQVITPAQRWGRISSAQCTTPDVTKGHSKWLWSRSRRWSRKFTSDLALATCSMVVLTILHITIDTVYKW